MQFHKYTLQGIVYALNGFDGSGNFLRTFPEGGWKGDATAGIKIRADRHDDHDQAVANALSNMICKDGQTTVLADIPFNGKRITGLGTPTAPTDAATKAYADSVHTFTTGAEISGADLNGRITFTSPTGINGLAWTGADLSWLARLATAAGPGTPPVPPATINRLVLNDKADGTGTDVVEVCEDGSIKAASLAATGAVTVGSLVATGAITATADINVKAASGNVHFWFKGPADEDRGVIYTSAASAGNMNLRTSSLHQFVFDTSGGLTIPGGCAVGNQLSSNTVLTNGIGCTGNLTANGTSNLNIVYTANPVQAAGYRTKAGINGGLQANASNVFWGGTYIDIYIDATPFRLLSGISDYRIKKDVQPLASTWDKVKALRPISYSTRDYGDLIKGDDEVQWGFLAHELQEGLTHSAAVGEKDGERIQSVNPFVIITALTKCIQEAQIRIEELEERLEAAA